MTELEELSAVTVETGRDPQHAVIWLHGLGADGHDFEPIIPELGLPAELAVRFIFPHAPRLAVTVNQGMVMRAWFDVLSLEMDQRPDEEGIRRSARQVEALLEAEKSRGIAAEHTVLAGFSQGGAIACQVGLRHREPLAGILVLSSFLPLSETLALEASPANRSTPVLLCHGIWDPLVPQRLSRRTAELLESQGYPVQWKCYPTAHSLHPREVKEIGRWLTEIFTAAR